MDFGDDVNIITEQNLLFPLIKASRCVISPASSTLIPAAYFRKAFINSLQPEIGEANRIELERLNQTLGDAIYHPSKWKEALEGKNEIDEAEYQRIFELKSFKGDGKNCARVLALTASRGDGSGPKLERSSGGCLKP